MAKFSSDSSVHGIEFFASKIKFVRQCGYFLFFLAFCGLGFYMHGIYVKWKVDPMIGEEVNLIPLREIPFPAVTICNPLFTRDQKPNLYHVLKSDYKKLKLSIEEQNHLAANVQACAPHLGDEILKFFNAKKKLNIVETLKDKFLNLNDTFAICAFRYNQQDCANFLSYVLTDHGFCFSYNLLGFNQLFNTKVLTDDFKSYQGAKGLADFSSGWNFTFKEIKNDTKVLWTLEEGYSTDIQDIHPIRSARVNVLSAMVKLNNSDISSNNFCQGPGKSFQVFFHMPNEILSPFHKPHTIPLNVKQLINVLPHVYKTDASLRVYSPPARGCYFEGERKLKFFKSYTKSNCMFECLTDETEKVCGCVKFSMPRNKSTKVCDLSKTKCYLKVRNNFSKIGKLCKCLQPCFDIDYKFTVNTGHFANPSAAAYSSNQNSSFSDVLVRTNGFLVQENRKFSLYSFYDEFGSLLGIFFGCSLLSILEIFHFSLFKVFKINQQSEISATFASESTIHGIKFIFDTSLKKSVRILWIVAFFISLSGCLYNAHESYVKLAVKPEIETVKNQKQIREIAFPSISICPDIVAKNGLANYKKTLTEIKQKKNLTTSPKELEYFTANLQKYHGILVYELEKSNNTLINSNLDITSLINESDMTIEELFHSCKFRGKYVDCNKIFKRVLSDRGFCYHFNLLNFHQIFNEEISHDFDSYGRQENQEVYWTLADGYKTSDDDIFPVRASEENVLLINLKLSHQDASNIFVAKTFLIAFQKPNEFTKEISHFSSHRVLFGSQKTFTFSAKLMSHHEDFRKFSPLNRGCFFTDERKLKFFKSYTQQNCENECLTNYTLQACGCVKFSMVRNDTTKICKNGGESLCHFLQREKFPPINDSVAPCGCLKTCTDIEYGIKSIKKESFEYPPNEIPENFTMTQIKFKLNDAFVMEEENFVGYGFKDFVTDVGGLLGLFLGCSMMSLGELFYFPFLILWRKFKKNENEVSHVDEIEIQHHDDDQGNLNNLNKIEVNLGEFKEINIDLERYFGEVVVHDLENETY